MNLGFSLVYWSSQFPWCPIQGLKVYVYSLVFAHQIVGYLPWLASQSILKIRLP